MKNRESDFTSHKLIMFLGACISIALIAAIGYLAEHVIKKVW